MKWILIFLSMVIFLLPGQLPGNITGTGNVDAFMTIDHDMKQFVDKYTKGITNRGDRLQTLIKSIYHHSLPDFEYSNLKTGTAVETFRNRKGNCLSYTAMFIAMARYAGLPARFQEVYSTSDWSRRGQMVVFNLHMNAVVLVDGKKIEVDFSTTSDTSETLRQSKIVSDRRAHAHFCNNIGAEALIRQEYKRAESLLNRAIQIDHTFSPSWTNLGVMYRHTGKLKLAEKAYLKAISMDKNDVSARVNLFRLFKERGELHKAVRIRQSIERVNNRNPFYHFNLGQDAYNKKRYRAAIKHFKRAIKRKSGEPSFYSRMAAAYNKLGDRVKADKYLKKAGE